MFTISCLSFTMVRHHCVYLLIQLFKSWKISVRSNYAISPQHAGVYPVHEELYDSWREIWDIHVTSTEEYPHFRPSSARRGFIYKNISVILICLIRCNRTLMFFHQPAHASFIFLCYYCSVYPDLTLSYDKSKQVTFAPILMTFLVILFSGNIAF